MNETNEIKDHLNVLNRPTLFVLVILILVGSVLDIRE